MQYQIRKIREADCDGGRTFFVVVDIDDNEREMSEYFETEKDAENFIAEIFTSNRIAE
jgi:hypothetical protein